MSHSNPYNLHYILSKSLPEKGINVISKKDIITDFGSCTMAIIGSSHYIIINNSIVEILTCNKLTDTSFIINRNLDTCDKHKFCFSFNKVVYNSEIEVSGENILSFNILESNLLKSGADLIFAFEKNSAITSLKVIENKKGLFSFETFHTYPGYNVIVRTKSSISAQ